MVNLTTTKRHLHQWVPKDCLRASGDLCQLSTTRHQCILCWPGFKTLSVPAFLHAGCPKVSCSGHVATLYSPLRHADNLLYRTIAPPSNGHTHRSWRDGPIFHQGRHCVHPTAPQYPPANAPAKCITATYPLHAITEGAPPTIAHNARNEGADNKPITEGAAHRRT